MEDGKIGRPLTRRFLLGQAAMSGLALATARAWAQTTVDLGLPGGPNTRPITRAFPQKTAMILQRSRPPLLETPFEVFDKGVFTANNEFYVRWHWAVIPTEVDVDKFRLAVCGHVNEVLSLSLPQIMSLPPVEMGAVCTIQLRQFQFVGQLPFSALSTLNGKPLVQRVRPENCPPPITACITP